MMQMVWRNPKRLVDPFDGVLHIAVPVATVLISWFCRSSTPVVCLWTAHSAMLFLGILESSFLRAAQWKEGRAWWIFAQLSVLAAYVANLMYNFTSEEDSTKFGVFGISMVWL